MFIDKVKALFRKGLVAKKGAHGWSFSSQDQEERPIATLAWQGLPNPPRIPGQVATTLGPPTVGPTIIT